MAKQEIRVPDIGGAEGAEVVELLVKVGDEIAVEQGLLVLESDKASMEIPSEVAGKVIQVLVSEGDEVAEGDTIAVVDTGDTETGEADETDEKEPAASTPGKEAEPASAEEESATGQDQAPVSNKAAKTSNTQEDTQAPEKQGEEAEEITVEVPDIGTDEAVDLIEFSVEVGDEVAEGDSLVVLESDKASMEVPSSHAGKVVKWLVKEGASVRQGDPLVVLSAPGTTGDEKKENKREEKKEKKEDTTDQSATEEGQSGAGKESKPESGKAAVSATDRVTRREPRETEETTSQKDLVYAGPAVRKLARELGVELGQVSGTGPRERIVKEDVHQFVQRALSNRGTAATSGAGIPAVPEIDFAAFGQIETVARTKLDKLTAANMHRSWLNVPHVTQWDDADITELEAFRKGLADEGEKRGTKLTPLPFMLKACALALRDNPKLNASLSADGESLVFKHYIHIGVAVDTPAGLMVPVIRDVDQKSLWQLAEEVAEMAGKARDRKLRPADMQGGCFTISSLGGLGGNGFTPIVNTPEVGILGVSRASVKPVWDGQAFQPRTLLPLALSYDHRVINGADAGRFCTQLVALLGDIRRFLL
ncbi:dihydrolipoyllysine-residue acetyltransferase [Kineobactrum sediminis]|uniref:Acetyltransferase component of pyruvate dehydrogenase complex n=1 Tax=Kineobactrum sediminis TaxID=1905677 RepID=A0A2N5XZV9_9GAMM|nr:dihydrolipoyllysine-residue acetyltransferase [Kineobactrum sediminis]PLW81675.1 dihydrolipoyllysine-residue acetyltransferase [Kineobactrum sediminis]